jgi:FtsZ-binding cell division protein ZapB
VTVDQVLPGVFVTDSTDQFQKLEEKLWRAIELFKRTQSEKHALRQDLEKLGSEAREHSQQIDALERQLVVLRREREDVRERIEKLLKRIDELTSRNSGG